MRKVGHVFTVQRSLTRSRYSFKQKLHNTWDLHSKVTCTRMSQWIEQVIWVFKDLIVNGSGDLLAVDLSYDVHQCPFDMAQHIRCLSN